MVLSDFSAQTDFRYITSILIESRKDKRENEDGERKAAEYNSLNSNKLVDCEFIINFGGPH